MRSLVWLRDLELPIVLTRTSYSQSRLDVDPLGGELRQGGTVRFLYASTVQALAQLPFVELHVARLSAVLSTLNPTHIERPVCV